jgi:hypothetical protein
MPKLRIHFRLVLIIYWFLSLHTCCCLAHILRCWLLYINWIISLCCQCLWIVHSVFSNVYVLLLTIYTFLCTYTHVRYDFRIKTMFVWSLPPVICALFTLFVFVCAYWCPVRVMLCFSSLPVLLLLRYSI